MTERQFYQAIAALASASLLAACSPSGDGKQDGSERAAERQFDEASKQAARILSLSQTAALAGNSAVSGLSDGDDYTRAVLCAEAIRSLGERFGQTGMLTGQQLRVLEGVGASFDQRATALQRDGRNRQSVVREYAERVDPDRRASADALLAMNCLQSWQAEN